jgi:hypothetical protein
MPHAFNQQCLIDKGVPDWQAFCQQFHIGITDIISCVPDAEVNNPQHVSALTQGFSDDALDKKVNGQFFFQLEFATQAINELISLHQQTLHGVFFTRNTFQSVPRISQNWHEIVAHCTDTNITAQALPSPSPKGGAIRRKIDTWRAFIEPFL